MENTTVALLNVSTSNLGISQVELWIQLIVFYGLAGTVTFVGYLMMTIGIIRTKHLRTRFFSILAFLVATRAVLSFQYLGTFVYRSLRTLNLAPTNLKRGYCFLLGLSFYYAQTVEVVLLLMSVVDKAMAILFITYYRTLTNRHAVVACSMACVITILLKLIPLSLDMDLNSTVACVNGNSPLGPRASIYNQYVDTVIAILILVFYVAMLLKIRSRVLPTLKNAQGNDELQLAYKRQMKLLPLLRRLVFIHCGFSLLAKFLGLASTVLSSDVAARAAAYFGILTNIDLFCNLIMLLLSNKDLRNATLMRINKVVPVVTGLAARTNVQEK